jgi:hypothetical protein
MPEPRTWLLATACAAALAAGAVPAHAQACPEAKLKRSLTITGGYVVLQTAVIAVRGDDWWSDSTQSFHFTWQGSPSLGQDRRLHAYFSYQTSQLAALAWDWACFDYVAAGWLGAAVGVAITLPKEIGDGFQSDGFDVPDFVAGVAGAVLPAMHRTYAPSRALLLKFNYWLSEEFRNRSETQPQLESDYAGMRFFLAVNPGRVPGGAGWWPDWLGVAWGHSVDHWISAPPNHQWYFTTDLNFRGIPIRAKWWHTVATVLDQFHVPLPGIKIQQGEVSFGLF